MYKAERQMKLEDFVFPYGKLNPENEWVKLAGLIPWDLVEERYASGPRCCWAAWAALCWLFAG